MKSDYELKPNEVIEDLGDGFKIIQNKTMFCYGTDAAKLSDFIVAKPKERLIDLCSGNGIIPILLCKKTKCNDITALEIQKEVCAQVQARDDAGNPIPDTFNPTVKTVLVTPDIVHSPISGSYS